MTIEINGMAHVILTVSRFELARQFYGRILPEFGMKLVFDGDRFFYCARADCDRHPTMRSGLHHLCLRARSREDMDKCVAVLSEMGAIIVRGHRRRHMGAGL